MLPRRMPALGARAVCMTERVISYLVRYSSRLLACFTCSAWASPAGVSAGSRTPCSRASSSIVSGRRQPSRCTCSSALGQRRNSSLDIRAAPPPLRAVTTTRRIAPPSPITSPASTGRPTPSVAYAAPLANRPARSRSSASTASRTVAPRATVTGFSFTKTGRLIGPGGCARRPAARPATAVLGDTGSARPGRQPRVVGGEAAQHREPAPTGGEEITHGNRVRPPVVHPAPVGERELGDPPTGALARIIPDFQPGDVRIGRVARDDVLQRFLQHFPRGEQPHEPVLERLHLVQIAIGHGAGGQIGPDTAVVHDRDVRLRDVALRVGDQAAEAVLLAGAAQLHLDACHRTAPDGLDGSLVDA